MKRGFAFLAIGLLCAMGAFTQDFPAYLTMDGTTIKGCDKAALPANLVIPEGVTEIGDSAFYECKSLESVSIPASMTKIGDFAFMHCYNIKTVQYRGTLAQWCEMDNDEYLVANAKTIKMSDVADLKAMIVLEIPEDVNKIGEGAFHSCTSFNSISIPEGVTEIGDWAFSKCTSLKYVLIPEGVKIIGKYAFHDCKSLADVTIPSSVTEIGKDAFVGCDNPRVYYDGTIAQWKAIEKGGDLEWDIGTCVVGCYDGAILPDGDLMLYHLLW